MHNEHLETFRIRTYQTGGRQQTAPPVLADLFQECASLHARELGFSGEDLAGQGLAWVLTRLFFRVERWPRLWERVTVRTWPSWVERRAAGRDFEARDEDGGLVAKATSSWMTMDMAARRMAPIPDSLVALHRSDQRAVHFPSRSIPRPGQARSSMDIRVRQSDLDVNGHVNNVRYLEWCLHSLEPFPGEENPSWMDISFRAEARLGEELTAISAPGENCDAERILLHAVMSDDGRELARAASGRPLQRH